MAAPRDNLRMRGVLNKMPVHVALVAMLLRALLPAGWMPSAPSQHHAASIMLCPGMDHMAMPVSPDHHKSDHIKSTYCACAAVAQISLTSPHVAVGAPLQLAHAVRFTAAAIPVAVAAIYRANAARAPPSLA
jgi:hypothetical protein